MIHKPYLLFLGDAHDQLAAKVAQGIRDWRPQDVVGQLRLPGCQADLKINDLTVAEAVSAGARTMVVGVANRGGVISPAWKSTLIEAVESEMDLASGLHNYLRDEPDLLRASKANGRQLHDVRQVSQAYPIANGQPRSGWRCLAVGTDVSVGKMYTTLALQRELAARNVKATFRATGQTGILIEGDGVPLDAVVADFMAGSIEYLTPENDPDHWDLIEGQGSLIHASYSGVTLALVHGGQPDALILCHDPARETMRGLPGYALPALEDLRDLSLRMARIVNPRCEVVGVSVNTSGLSAEKAEAYVRRTSNALHLPVTDPIRYGVGDLADALLAMSVPGN